MFAGITCAKTDNTKDFQRLSDKSCVAYAEAKLKPTLSPAWQPYLAATRVCPLVKKAGDKPEIVLVSVFSDDYYRNKPMDAVWENFPKPIFFNKDGNCVARLPDLYPTEPPRDLEITYGHWKNSIPQEIRTHVLNPAVTGDYDLPKLIWDEKTHQYNPLGESFGNKKARMGCP